MLSTKVVGNVSQASHYFLGHDNYYSEDQSLAEERSAWWGKGAESLGLSGHVEGSRFTELLEGKISASIIVGKKIEDKIEHRPGFDLTFSAPKSVSMLALMGGDARIFKAVEKATDKVLSMIEEAHAQARVTKDGITEYVKTGNLVVARFLHDLSREADPQLHTHCVVMNLTEREDGEWRSLASEIGNYGVTRQSTPDGFIEAVRHHKKYYGAIFRAELAYEMKQLGYQIEKTGNQGFFEISGISPESIKAYSQRREDIEAYLKEKGFTGAKAAAVANLNTRQKKVKIDRESLQELWREKEKVHEVNAFLEAKKTMEESLAISGVNKDEADKRDIYTDPHMTYQRSETQNLKRAIIDAISHLSETQVALRENEVIHLTLKNMTGNTSVTDVLKLVDEAKKEGALIPLPNLDVKMPGETYFTTPQLLRYERDILVAALLEHPNARAMLTQKKLTTFLKENETLNQEQKQALTTLFSSKNQVLLLAGHSGSGKTHLIAPMMKLGQVAGYQPILLTPGKTESLNLEEEIKKTPLNLREGIRELFHQKKFDTVSSFLAQEKNKLNQPKGILSAEVLFYQKPLVIVDRAGVLSSKQMCELQGHVANLGGRLIAIHDPEGQQSWQAGNPFHQMLKHGVTVAFLTENQRTKDADLKEAISDTLSGQIKAAFSRVNHRIFSIEDKTERMTLMTAHYTGLSPDTRKEALLLMPTKGACEEITPFIREQLKQQGELGKEGQLIRTLLPHNMTEVSYQYAKNYQIGQWVRFHNNYASIGVTRDDYREISKIDNKNNTVFFKGLSGELIRWQPDKLGVGKVEVFDAKIREIVQGEQLVCRRNDKEKGIYNGEVLKVIAVKDSTLTLNNQKGKTIILELNKPSDVHLDYGYASTPHQKKAGEPHTVIAYQSSYSRQTHQRAFYQILGKAKEHAWIYTENKDRLLSTLQSESGDKVTAIDALLRSSAFQAKDVPVPGHQAQEHRMLLERAVENAIFEARQSITPEGMAERSVYYALAHLTEKEAAFSHRDVLETALKHALGDVNNALISKAVDTLEQRGEIIRGVCSTDGVQWTTQEALTKEAEILEMGKRDEKRLPSLLQDETITRYLSEHPVNEEHAKVLKGLGEQKNRISIIAGFAGTGKTTLLGHMDALLKLEDKSLLCLAPTHTAVKEIRGHGLPGKTLDQFLVDYRAGKLPADLSNTVIVVDESSMISNSRLHTSLALTHDVNARTFFMGDVRQYPSISSGKPLHLLQKAGVTTFSLTTINRQKNETLKTAVKEVYQKEFQAAFETLKHHIVEIDHPEDCDVGQFMRLEKIRDDYLSRDPVRRAQTMIITFGNQDRILQNALIHEGLKEEGTLLGTPLTAYVLLPRHLNEIERTHAIHYKEGDILRFNIADSALGIEKDQYYTVKSVHSAHNVLSIQKEATDEKGECDIILWKTDSAMYKGGGSKVEVYEREKRDVLVGDLIRWTRTDKNRGLLSQELATVTNVDEKGFEVRSVAFTAKGVEPVGEAFYLDNSSFRSQHFDHSYAMTGYSTQGKGVNEIIVNIESYRKKLTSQPAFLVAITRPVHHLTLYTDNKEELLKAILGNTGEKKSALETIRDFPYENKVIKARKTDTHISSNKAKKIDKDTSITTLSTQKTEIKLDARHIKDQLKDRTEEVVERLLGEPKSRDGSQYRYGTKKGSLVVSLQGDKRGFWHDFQTGEGGNLLSLVAREQGLDIKKDYKEVLKNALQTMGMSQSDPTFQQQIGSSKKVEKYQENNVQEMTLAQKKSLRYAEKLNRESKPISNTLAERYLREHRGIRLDAFPENIRFHPGIYSQKNEGIYPALLVVAKDDKQKVSAVQAIFLDKNTAQKADVRIKKQTWGQSSKGNVVLDNPQKNDKTYLAEGPETALSIYAALGKADVRITLGKSNFKNINPEKTAKDIVLCLDNDGKSTDAEKLIQFASEALIRQQKNVFIAMPEATGHDYNDVLKTQGLSAVKQEIIDAIPYQSYQDKLKQLHSPRSMDTDIKEAKNLVMFDGISPDIFKNGAKILPETNSDIPIWPVDIFDNKANNGQVIENKAEKNCEISSVKNNEFEAKEGQKNPGNRAPEKSKELEL